jgi:ketol-acid reductoisomerase
VILLLVPDEVLPSLFDREIVPGLRPGNALVFAAGYNLYYGLTGFQALSQLSKMRQAELGRWHSLSREPLAQVAGAPSKVARAKKLSLTSSTSRGFGPAFWGLWLMLSSCW